MASIIPALSTTQIAGLSTTTIANLTSADWAAFATHQIVALTTAQAAAISSTQIVNLTSTQLYTVQNIGHLIGEALAARGAGEGGLAWHYCRPPVVDIEFEMDVRSPAFERVI